MPVIPPFMTSTRSALLIETNENGEKKILIYHLAPPISITVEQDYEMQYNVFEMNYPRYKGFDTRVSIEAYLGSPQEYQGDIPEREEIEHTKAITDGNDEIIIEPDEYDEWDE